LPLVDDVHLIPGDLPEPESVVLRPGDLLYIPRGFVHEAHAEARMTLHLTIRVEPLRRLDLAMASLRWLARSQAELREAIAPGFLDGYVGPRSAVTELGREFLGGLRPVLDGEFEVLDAVRDLGLESIVSRRVGMISFIEIEGRNLRLCFRGGAVVFPRRIQGAIEFVISVARFAVNDIPALDCAGKIGLARRLIRAGYLTVVSEP
jgi:hypothetical protein